MFALFCVVPTLISFVLLSTPIPTLPFVLASRTTRQPPADGKIVLASDCNIILFVLRCSKFCFVCSALHIFVVPAFCSSVPERHGFHPRLAKLFWQQITIMFELFCVVQILISFVLLSISFCSLPSVLVPMNDLAATHGQDICSDSGFRLRSRCSTSLSLFFACSAFYIFVLPAFCFIASERQGSQPCYSGTLELKVGSSKI